MPARRSARRVRLLRLALPFAALLASLLLPSFHVAAAHHGGFSSPTRAGLVASHGTGPGHGSPSAQDPDTCSLCRVIGYARNLLAARDRLPTADLAGPARALHPPYAVQTPAQRSAAVAGPRAPPPLPFQS